MIRALLGLMPAILLGIVFFLINPIFGVLWVLWLLGVAIIILKRNKK